MGMKIQIVAIGTKMPLWVEQGCEEYRKRLPRDFSVEIRELPLATRGKSTSTKIVVEKEGEKLLATAGNSFIVALDVDGTQWSTELLARQIDQWRVAARPVSLLIGGPDGLSPACLAEADARWSLSALTLPHALVRVVVLEQLYRAWSLLNHHPYHK